MKISLKQFLMRTGKFKKSYNCEVAIKSGKVSVNNQMILNPNCFFNPKKSIVKLNNEKLKPVPKLYLLLNKPAGYVCQKSKNEKTIYDLFKKINLSKESISSLFSVGRLDKKTEGLLIITNDGKLASTLMKPDSNIIKKYYAVLEKPIKKGDIKKIEDGIEIFVDNSYYKTIPSKIKIVWEKEVYISISEGKKRQIRKMFEAFNNKVLYLKRVSIGGLQLGKLAVGEIKEIAREEIMEKLFQ